MGALTDRVVQMTRQMIAAWPPAPGPDHLNGLLRLAGRWRSQMLANTYVSQQGTVIHSGPFKGMTYLAQATEGALIPRLLGVYESELHPHLASFAAEAPDCVIDVGCAEGYYAVGLARMMPATTVYAYDIDPKARTACAALAAQNGVGDRVIIGEEFKPDGFQAFAGRKVLIMVDAEGAEFEILQPDLSPALAGMSIIVETHDVYRKGALAEMIRRFTPTHDIERVDIGPRTFDAPAWLLELNQFDQLIAAWDWRIQNTPWLVMRPKAA